MEKATWEEIKALASDFKRTQAITLNQKLTERNCIDIINYLCSTNQISLHFTTDGKTFITPQELEKEIYEELEISNDRIELTKLSSSLDVDLYTVENTVNKMIINDLNLQIVMGNLINTSYIRGVCLKINEIIKDKGKITILELTQHFNLPKNFIEKIINNNLESVIEAHKDCEMLYTNNFIRRHIAMIRGYLTRSSKPVTIIYLHQKFTVSEKLIIKIINDLVDIKRINGKFDQNKSIFIPNIHYKNQKLYLQCFYEQNNYLDFSTMKEIGIQSASKYVESEFPEMTILSSCALGYNIISQLEMSIQECEKNSTYFNCYQIMPPIVNLNDLQIIIKKTMENNDKLMLMAEEFIVSKDFVSKCVLCFDDIIRSKAEEFVKKNKKSSLAAILSEISFQDNHSEENVTKSGEKIMKFKSGGGQRGREIKVKSVKNKYMSDKKVVNKKSTQDTNVLLFDFINEDEGVEIMLTKLNEAISEDLLREIFQLIDKQLQSSYKAKCKLLLLQSSDSNKNKSDHKQLEIKISMMINKIKMFEKGLEEINESTLKLELTKYYLKSLCGDVVNSLCEYIASENDCEWDSSNVTNESRLKLVPHINHNLSVALKSLIKTLKESETLDGFYSSCETICALLDVFPKKLDKKNEKNLIQELAAQYHYIVQSKCDANESIDPAELLLVTTLLIFQKLIGYPLHASGKFVPSILEFLRNRFADIANNVDWDSLKQYQDYVIASIKIQNLTEEKDAFNQTHQDLHLKINNMALNWKNMKNL